MDFEKLVKVGGMIETKKEGGVVISAIQAEETGASKWGKKEKEL